VQPLACCRARSCVLWGAQKQLLTVARGLTIPSGCRASSAGCALVVVAVSSLEGVCSALDAGGGPAGVPEPALGAHIALGRHVLALCGSGCAVSAGRAGAPWCVVAVEADVTHCGMEGQHSRMASTWSPVSLLECREARQHPWLWQASMLKRHQAHDTRSHTKRLHWRRGKTGSCSAQGDPLQAHLPAQAATVAEPGPAVVLPPVHLVQVVPSL
jgi:hypothetical protein